MKQNNAQTIISLHNVTLSRGSRTILSDVNLDIRQGEFILITGPNGGGKTTLLRLILKLVNPDSGSVSYSGDCKNRIHPGVGYLPQKSAVDSRFPITVRQLIDSGFESPYLEATKSRRVEATDAMMGLLGLGDRAEYSLGMLSGGQLQRALLGRALVSNPAIVIMDEPLSYLDERFANRFYEIIGNLPADTTVIVVSHDTTVLSRMADRHLIVDCTVTEV